MRSFESTLTATGSLDARDRQLRPVGRLGEQRGAILPIMALLLVVLLGGPGSPSIWGSSSGIASRSSTAPMLPRWVGWYTSQTTRAWPGGRKGCRGKQRIR